VFDVASSLVSAPSELVSDAGVDAAEIFFRGGAGAVRPLPVLAAAILEAGVVSPLFESAFCEFAFFAANFSFHDSPVDEDDDGAATALLPRGAAAEFEVVGFVDAVEPGVPHFLGATLPGADAPLGVTPAAVDSEPRLLPAADDGPADEGPADDGPADEVPAGLSSDFSLSASFAASAALSAAFCCHAGTTFAGAAPPAAPLAGATLLKPAVPPPTEVGLRAAPGADVDPPPAVEDDADAFFTIQAGLGFSPGVAVAVAAEAGGAVAAAEVEGFVVSASFFVEVASSTFATLSSSFLEGGTVAAFLSAASLSVLSEVEGVVSSFFDEIVSETICASLDVATVSEVEESSVDAAVAFLSFFFFFFTSVLVVSGTSTGVSDATALPLSELSLLSPVTGVFPITLPTIDANPLRSIFSSTTAIGGIEASSFCDGGGGGGASVTDARVAESEDDSAAAALSFFFFFLTSVVGSTAAAAAAAAASALAASSSLRRVRISFCLPSVERPLSEQIVFNSSLLRPEY
jgi:hypothetical protein